MSRVRRRAAEASSARPRMSALRSVLVVLGCLAAIATGAVLVVEGLKSHPPAPAPLPKHDFRVDPARLPRIPAAMPRSGERVRGKSPHCSATLGAARVIIPALCVDGRVVTTSLAPDGSLIIPVDVHVAGLWNGGAPLVDTRGRPMSRGTTLLAGHVNYIGQGNGAFYDLYRAKAGDVVYVTDASGAVTRWQVDGVTTVVKSALPRWLFAGRIGPRRLALVTCGGPILHLDGYNTYRDNVIVEAVPA